MYGFPLHLDILSESIAYTRRNLSFGLVPLSLEFMSPLEMVSSICSTFMSKHVSLLPGPKLSFLVYNGF